MMLKKSPFSPEAPAHKSMSRLKLSVSRELNTHSSGMESGWFSRDSSNAKVDRASDT